MYSSAYTNCMQEAPVMAMRETGLPRAALPSRQGSTQISLLYWLATKANCPLEESAKFRGQFPPQDGMSTSDRLPLSLTSNTAILLCPRLETYSRSAFAER